MMNPFASYIPRSIPEQDTPISVDEEVESPTSTDVNIGSASSTFGVKTSTLSGLGIVPRSMTGYRIGFDRTYDRILLRASLTRENITRGNQNEELEYPPTQKSLIAFLEMYCVIIKDMAPVFSKAQKIAFEEGSEAARQSFTDQDMKKLTSLIVQSLIMLSYIL